MNIDKDKLIKFIDDNLDVVYTDEDMAILVEVVDEMINNFFTPSAIKEKLYQGIIKRELKDRYEESRYGTQCIKCGRIAHTEEGTLVHKHYRRCPTAQLERIASL